MKAKQIKAFNNEADIPLIVFETTIPVFDPKTLNCFAFFPLLLC